MSADVNLQGAYLHYQNKDFDKAEQWVQSILKPKPLHKAALHLGAMIALERGDVNSASARIEAALRQEPTHVEMLNTLGNINKRRHDPVRAEGAYRAALAQQSEYIAARQNLAFLLLEQRQPDLALAEFDRLISMKPDNNVYKLARVYALKDCGKAQDALNALNALDDASASDDIVAERSGLRARILFNLGEYADAIEANAAALASEKHGASALSNAAQTLFMLGQWNAGRDLLRAVTKGPKARLDLAIAGARAFARAGEHDEAMAQIESGLSAYGNAPSLLALRGELRLLSASAAEDKRAAYTDLKAALTAEPGHLLYMAEFARAALSIGEPNEAMIAAEAALKVVPNDQFWIAIKATAGRMMGQNYRYYYDYDNFIRSYTLSAPNGYSDMEQFNAALKDALASEHSFKSAPLDQSLRAGIQTRNDLRFSSNPVIQAFFTALDEPIRDYIAHIGYDPSHALRQRNTGGYRLTGAWSVELSAGGHHVNHVHPMGWISSSYYVQVPDETRSGSEKEGWIEFGAPPLDIDGLEAEKSVQPKAGLLVLFPSYMWHGTRPITGSQTRLTLPFDVVPA